jgi:dihydrofolate synthase/folylpolyglutamate synthase
VLGVEALAESGFAATPEVIRTGLAAVRWPGRLEVLRRSPAVVVDGAHTPDSARRLGEALATHFPGRRLTVVAGLSADKDIEGFARALSGSVPLTEVIATRAEPGRAAPSEQVAAAFAAVGVPVVLAPSVAAATEQALASAGRGDTVCITGSLYVVAEARAWLLGLLPDGVAARLPG